MADVQIAVIDQQNTQIALAAPSETQVNAAVPGVQGPAGEGVPQGGTANQVLFKQSGTDYDTAWGEVTSAMIGDLEIVDADVSASAAIAGTKISPNFGSQNVVTAGTSTAASFIPTSSTVPTNGVYLPSANTVALSTNGTGRLFVDANGNVGVGTAYPENYGGGYATLEVRGTSGTAGGIFQTRSFDAQVRAYFYADSSSNTARIGTVTNHPFLITTGTQERLRITTNGNVELNTTYTDPQIATFSLRPGFLASAVGGVGLGCVNHSGSANDGLGVYGHDGISLYTSAAERLRITSGGYVGVGTSTPGGKFHILNPSGGASTTAATTIERDNSGTFIRLHRNAGSGNAGGLIGADSVAAYFAGGSNTNNQLYIDGANAVMQFYTNGSERARIDSSGRLLAGTSTSRLVEDLAGNGPQGLIQIEAANSDAIMSIISAGTADATRAGTLSLGRHRNSTVGGTPTIVQNGDNLGAICFAGGDGTDMRTKGASIAAQVDGTPGLNAMPGRIVLSTTAAGASNPTERMRIAQDGVVTIQNGAVAVIDALTDGAAITPDFAAGCNFTVTLGGNRTVANPNNLTAGQSGSIFLVQDATGSRTVSWGSYWDFPGGTAPTLSTAANAVDRVDYIVRSSTSIHTVFTANYS